MSVTQSTFSSRKAPSFMLTESHYFAKKNQIWQKPEPTTLHSIMDKTVEKSPVLADYTSTRSTLQPFSKRVDFRYIRQFTFVNDFQSRLLYNIENECITQAAIEMFCLSVRLCR